MGLIKGSLSLTRYRVKEEPPETLTDEYVSERLNKNAFVDIEDAPEEKSLGWVEFLNPLDSNFNPATYRFGGILAFTLRLDSRKVPGKTVSRYYNIREAQYVEKIGRAPNSVAKRELKEAIKSELLRRALLNTELMEAAWLYQENEVWLAAVGEKRRETFEELWGRTFGLSLQMLVPATVGLELLSGNLRKSLLDSKASAIWLGG